MLSEVIDQMEQKHRQEGLEKGLQKGIREARRTNALRMLRKNYPIEEVMEITELSRDEVKTLAKQVAATEKE
jgi:predicted transposase/invertase (TIGR01784 family)